LTKEFLPIWIDEYTIHSYESDKRALATPTALLQFMQESAWNHAEHLNLGFSHLSPKGLAWVLARLSLKVEKFPRWHTRVKLETWPSGLDRLLAHRDFRISSSEGLLAVGSTSWLVIDVENRRPQRTSSYFEFEQWEAERVFSQFTGKIPQLQHSSAESARKVYFSHLDVNGHVNNVRYLEYVIDSFPLDFITEHDLALLEMNFLAEALYGDSIRVKTQNNGDLSFLHSVQRQNEDDELCRLKTTWKKAKPES